MDTLRTRTFPSRFASLSAISEFVTTAARAAGLQPAAVYAVQMAVDEACTNIIEHAYGGEGNEPIQCTCHITADGLTIILHDYGRPFDPTAVTPPNLEAKLQDRSSGGLGVHFIRQLMDQVRFEFSPHCGNKLIMVKCRETPPWPIHPK